MFAFKKGKREIGNVHFVDGIADIPHGVARDIFDKVIHGTVVYEWMLVNMLGGGMV